MNTQPTFTTATIEPMHIDRRLMLAQGKAFEAGMNAAKFSQFCATLHLDAQTSGAIWNEMVKPLPRDIRERAYTLDTQRRGS